MAHRRGLFPESISETRSQRANRRRMGYRHDTYRAAM